MNILEKMKFRNDVARLIGRLSVKRNVVNFNAHNTVEHEMIKARICFELQKLGIHYITEAPFKKANSFQSGQADILVLDKCQVIEIMVSEKLSELEWKIRKFPKELEIIAVTSWQDYFSENYKVIKHGI